MKSHRGRGRTAVVDWEEVGPVLLLEHPGVGVVVLEAEVDVFAVQRRDGGGQDVRGGSWTLLGRLPTGAILVGGAVAGDLCIAIRRQPEAVLRRFTVPSDGEASGSSDDAGGHVGTDVRGVRKTLRALDGLRREQLPPRDFDVLRPGSVELRRRGVARPIDTDLWIRDADQVQVHGYAGGVIEPSEWVGLTKDNWIEATARTVVQSHTTLDLAVAGHLWQALTDHVTHLLRESSRLAAIEGAERQRRIEATLVRDAATVPTVIAANHRLAFGAETELEFLGGVGPHAAAMIRVARAAGYRLSPDPSLRPALMQATSYEDVSVTGWLRTRPLRLEPGWWRSPGDGFVTVYGPSRSPCSVIFDHDVPWIHVSGDEAARLVEEDDLPQIRPEAQVVEVPAPSSVVSVTDLLRLCLVGSRRELLQLVACSLVFALISMLIPIASGQILGELIQHAAADLFVQVGLLLLAALVLGVVMQWMQNLLVLRLKGRLVHRVGVAVWGKLLSLPLPFFEARSPGALGTVVLGVRHLNEALSGALVVATLGLTVGLANLTVVWLSVPAIGLALTAGVVLVAILVFRLFRQDVELAREQHLAQQRANGLTLGVISTVSKLRVAGAENRALARWSASQREAFAPTLRARLGQGRVMVIAAILPLVSLALVFTVALWSPASWELTSLLTAIVATQLAVASFVAFIPCLAQLSSVLPMLWELRPILQAEPEIGEGKAQPGDLSGDIQLREVSFRYGNEGPLVLDRLNLTIRRGEFVAIVGPSGSGKSTVLRMLLGFDRPDSGSVLYDGQDLAELDAAAVRRQCGIVLQNNATLPGSIRDNICGGGDYSDSAVWEAAEMAGIAEEVRAMPMKLSTHVPDGAAGLSGGQRQRLMIARALISKPRIVMFDEATSALDNPTQATVTESTRLLSAARIVVAHRLSTIRDADRIVVLRNGAVVEEGSFDTLLARGGLFAEMVATQS